MIDVEKKTDQNFVREEVRSDFVFSIVGFLLYEWIQTKVKNCPAVLFNLEQKLVDNVLSSWGGTIISYVFSSSISKSASPTLRSLFEFIHESGDDEDRERRESLIREEVTFLIDSMNKYLMRSDEKNYF